MKKSNAASHKLAGKKHDMLSKTNTGVMNSKHFGVASNPKVVNGKNC